MLRQIVASIMAEVKRNKQVRVKVSYLYNWMLMLEIVHLLLISVASVGLNFTLLIPLG